MKLPVVKDADGNIVETSLMEMLELRGNKVTFDYQGNIIVVKHPKPKSQRNVTYQVTQEIMPGLNLDEIDDNLDEADTFRGSLDTKTKSGAQDQLSAR